MGTAMLDDTHLSRNEQGNYFYGRRHVR
jgi:hypothetical protein